MGVRDGSSSGMPQARRDELLTVHLLGRIEVRVGTREISVGGARERALLADLALHPNETLSTGTLIRDLWEDEPPPSATKMVQILVSKLRRTLDLATGGHVALQTHANGYSFVIRREAVDVGRVDALVAGADVARQEDVAAAGQMYREALDLWRGQALGDIRDFPFAVSAAARLDELRLHVFEEWVDTQLATGHSSELVADLLEAVERDPLRERIRAQLMLALYRSGRQADALRIYVETHRLLGDELGIEPSTELQELQRAILDQAPSLEPDRRGAPSSKTAAGRIVPMATEPRRGRRPVRRAPLVAALAALTGAGIILVAAMQISAGIGAGSSQAGVIPATDPGVVVTSDSIALFDTTRDQVVADIPVGSAPGPVSIDAANVWVGNVGDRTVSQIDRSTRHVVGTFGLSSAPTSLTSGDGVLWIGNGFTGALSRILTAYQQQTGPFFPTSQVAGLLAVATSEGAVWVGVPDAELVRLDPQSVRATTTIALPERARAITTLLGAVWYVGFGTSVVHEVDPNDVTSPRSLDLPGHGVAIASGLGSIWVATAGPDQLLQIDPRNATVVRTVELPDSPAGLAVTTDAVWVVTTSGALERSDRTGTAIARFELGRPLVSIAAAGQDLWVSAR